MSPLERRFRVLMVTYPAKYRLEREDEIVTTLLDTTDPSQMWPTVRQAADLLSSGCAVRAASNGAEDRRRGRERASWIAASVMVVVTSLVLSLWISGVFPSVSGTKFVALWSPFIALPGLAVWAPTKLLRRFGWIPLLAPPLESSQAQNKQWLSARSCRHWCCSAS